MPIYKGRREGTWRVTLFVRGKQHEWVVEGKKADAATFEARKRIELDAVAPPSTRTAPRFATFCVEIYRPHAKAHLRPATWDKVRRYQVDTLSKHLGKLKLTEITPKIVDDYKRTRLGQRWRDKPIGPTAINNELRVLRVILAHARSLGYPCADFEAKRLPQRGPGRVRVWNAAQLRALLAAAREHVPELLPMLVFLVNTGCRKGEAIAAERSWVDEGARMLRIPVNDVWRPKSNKPREVPISTSLAAVLAGLPEGARWLFPSPKTGERYEAFPEELFRRARDAAGLAGGPHTLRHSFASAFLQARPDMFLLAQVLGHSHARVSELYSHLLPDHLERARDAVDLAPPVPGGVEASGPALPDENSGGGSGG